MSRLQEGPFVDILIIKFRNPEVEKKCFEFVDANTKWPYRLTVVNNERGSKNMARIWNRFIVDSNYDYVAVLDSDTEPRFRWLSGIMGAFESRPDAGVVVPVTNRCGEQMQMQALEGVTLVPHGHVSGFCFVMRTQAWLDAGPFDEEFDFYGQDAEFFVRMTRVTDWKVYIQPKSYVHHEGAGSTKYDPSYDFARDKEKAVRLFYQKTGGVRVNGPY